MVGLQPSPTGIQMSIGQNPPGDHLESLINGSFFQVLDTRSFLMALFQGRWLRCVAIAKNRQEEGDTDSDSNEGNGGPEEFEMLDVWRASAKAMRLGLDRWVFTTSGGFHQVFFVLFWWHPWERVMGIFFVNYILCSFWLDMFFLKPISGDWDYMLLFGIILWNRPDLGFQWIGFRENLGQKPQWYLGWCDA